MGVKQGRFPAWFFAERRMSIFAENCICCQNLILLENFRTLQQFYRLLLSSFDFQKLRHYCSPPQKNISSNRLTYPLINGIIILIMNKQFDENKPSSALRIWTGWVIIIS